MTRSVPRLIAIVGATAVGKTEIALAVAEHLGGEIVNADATAMYRHLNIGSAKPRPEELLRAPHHLVDIAEPDQPVTVGEYQRHAYAAIDDIVSRGKAPLLVGGSGLYMRAVLEGYVIPEIAPGRVRTALEKQAAEKGAEQLFKRLEEIDPEASRGIHRNNVRRVIRALEVFEVTGTPISSFWKKRDARYRPVRIGLMRDRSEIYRRIDLRIEKMIDEGLVEEVKGILDMGFAPDSHAFSAIGYKELIPHVQGTAKLEDSIAAIRRATRKLARLQLTSWFPKSDDRITWFSVVSESVQSDILEFLRSNGIPG